MRNFFKLALCLMLLSGAAFAELTQNQRVKTALNILDTFGQDNEKLAEKNRKINLKDVKGIVIIPDLVKSGFIISGHNGSGIFVAKNDDNEWSSPIFVDFRGGGIGAQAGYQSSDLIVLFRSSRSYDGLVNGKGALDISVDAAIMGVGEKAAAMTDLPEISAFGVSKSKERGIFFGVSLNASNLVINMQDTNDYYERMYAIEDIYNNSPKDSRYTKKLKEIINKYFESEK